MSKPTFQAVRVSFKNPENGEVHTGFCVCEGMMSGAEFEETFRGEHKTEAVMLPTRVSPPMTFEDLAAFPEFEKLLDKISEGIDKVK